MREFTRFALLMAVLLSSTLLTGCPPNGNGATFPYYVTNLTQSSLTELKFPDGDTLQYVNVLDSPVPKFKMRIIRLNRAQFENSLSELTWRLEDNTSGSISARITAGAGDLGFVVYEYNSGIVGGIYEVDDDAKALPAQLPGQ